MKNKPTSTSENTELDELHHLQATLRQFKYRQNNSISTSVYRANLIMQKVAMTLLTVLISIELLTGHTITNRLVASDATSGSRLLQLFLIFVFLVICLLFSLKTLKDSAARSGDRIEDFVTNSFKSYVHYKHFTDLLIKLLIIAAFILGNKPEWVAPLLLLFTADYLFQMRYFSFSYRTSLRLGAATALLSLLQFYWQNVYVIWPLVWFAVLTMGSIYSLRQLKKIPDLDKGEA